MATVVNTNEFRKVFIDLGWDKTLSLSEVCDWLGTSGIDSAGFLAFCRALLAAPDGLDDTTIVGADGHPTEGEMPYIEDFLRSKGCVA